MIAGRFLLVCAGGAIGTAARYLAALSIPRLAGSAFPFATMFVNVAGSLLIAFIMHVGSSSELLSPDMRLFLTTGVMGGFTTYSTFNYETTEFLREGAWGIAAANILGTVVLCLAGGFAGLALARAAVGR